MRKQYPLWVCIACDKWSCDKGNERCEEGKEPHEAIKCNASSKRG